MREGCQTCSSCITRSKWHNPNYFSLQVTPGWCLSPLQTLATNDPLIPCWQGGDLCYLMGLCPPPQCLVRAPSTALLRHQELWEPPSISVSVEAAAGHTNIPRSWERQPARIRWNDLGISPAAAVRSKWLEARDQRIDSILQLNFRCEIPAQQGLKAPRQRGSIRVTQWAEGLEFSPSWFMAVPLIGTSHLPIF